MTFMMNNLLNLVSSLAVAAPSASATGPAKAVQAGWTSALADAANAAKAAASPSAWSAETAVPRSLPLVVQEPTASTVALAAKTPVADTVAQEGLAADAVPADPAPAEPPAAVPTDTTVADAAPAVDTPADPAPTPATAPAPAPTPVAAAPTPAPMPASSPAPTPAATPAPNTEFERQQAYLANVRQFLAQTSSGAYITGSSTGPNGFDGAARLPVDMVSAGITPSAPVLDDYTRVTGLDARTVTSPPQSSSSPSPAAAGPSDFERQQAYLANVRQLLATQSAGSYLTGSSSMADGTDGAAYLPSEMISAGITPSQAVLDAYSRVTGLDAKTVSATRPSLDMATGTYRLKA